SQPARHSTGRSTVTGSRRNERGFTLIELMVVVSIIVTLATIGMVQYRQSVLMSREAVLRSDLHDMREAIDQYYADKNKDPSALEDFASEVSLGAMPKDPSTNSIDTGQPLQSDPDPANPSATVGIRDVKSGSEQTAMDGSRYADW